MRIAVTGHTSGLGKCFFDTYHGRGYAVKGFSRKNGYDLSLPAVQDKFVEEVSREIDVFINNAHSGWSQCELLYKICDKWKDEKKTIVNIGSNSSDGNKDYVHKYAVEKSALEKVAVQLNNIKSMQCKIVLVKPSWILTERTGRMKISDPMLNPQHVIDLVDFILNLPFDLHVPSVSLCRKG